jgi:hypothetical protein
MYPIPQHFHFSASFFFLLSTFHGRDHGYYSLNFIRRRGTECPLLVFFSLESLPFSPASLFYRADSCVLQDSSPSPHFNQSISHAETIKIHVDSGVYCSADLDKKTSPSSVLTPPRLLILRNGRPGNRRMRTGFYFIHVFVLCSCMSPSLRLRAVVTQTREKKNSSIFSPFDSALNFFASRSPRPSATL